MNHTSYDHEVNRPSFNYDEESWFSEPKRKSVIPSEPAPPLSVPEPIDDPMADEWFI